MEGVDHEIYVAAGERPAPDEEQPTPRDRWHVVGEEVTHERPSGERVPSMIPAAMLRRSPSWERVLPPQSCDEQRPTASSPNTD
ncbi:hypothetical protein HUO13_28590 [Saccharopolyspora erythraea]|uniref:hypothetical protein n=1 Tax=Saccharopolyspora erythraea TaxID=1836 RepID=UPI001BA77009|nr:hypothetical protein [Saccharopolyspora erythraea]QUH04223.1 hypothetical protein HUO13_28590 [Saccharopolyspora erythraea]